MPVYKLMNEMPYDELLAWIHYFETRPIGWREDLRTAYMMRTFGDKRKPGEIFASIAAIESRPKKEDPVASLKGSSLFSRMLSAKKGDKLENLGDI
jgi:hypothetical protein